MKVESGELLSWQSNSISPSNWSGFTIFNEVQYFYDTYGRKSVEKAISSGITYSVKQYSYDSLNRIECETVRMNPAAFNTLPSNACTLGSTGLFGPDRIKKYDYDYRGKVLSIKNAVGTSLEQTTASYTYHGDLILTITDANGNVSKMDYDGFGRQTYWYFPSKTSVGSVNYSDYEHYVPDQNGNQISIRKRDGNTITNTYDNLNRLTKKDISGTSADVYYDYDLRGQMLFARFSSSSGQGITNDFNGFGKLASTTNNMSGTAQTLSYLYDKNGNRERITFPDNKIFTYEYDGLDGLTKIRENGLTVVATITYNKEGTRDNLLRSGGALTSYGFDEMGRLNSLSENFSGSTYDITNSFDFNPASQLISLTTTNSAFDYTDEDNITGSYGINGLNQYTSAGGKTFTYDTKGNLIYDGYTTFTYDIENRLTSASGAKSATLKYDPIGRLYETVGGGVTTRFLYDGQALVAEYNTSGAITKRYIHGSREDEPLFEYVGSTVSSSTRTGLHTDRLGSIIARSNSSSVLTSKNSYDSYGIPAATNVGRFGYTGQIFIPEVGLYYYKARMYSPKLGRLMQIDPVGYKDQFNLYSYVKNDPMNKKDPTGRESAAADLDMGELLNMAIDPDSRSPQDESMGDSPSDFDDSDDDSDFDDSFSGTDEVDGFSLNSTDQSETMDNPKGLTETNYALSSHEIVYVRVDSDGNVRSVIYQETQTSTFSRMPTRKQSFESFHQYIMQKQEANSNNQ